MFLCRAHDDPNFVNSKIYLPPELQIAPPKKASTVGGGGVGSGLVKVAALKSFTGASTRGKGGRRGRPPKQDVSFKIVCSVTPLTSNVILFSLMISNRKKKQSRSIRQ